MHVGSIMLLDITVGVASFWFAFSFETLISFASQLEWQIAASFDGTMWPIPICDATSLFDACALHKVTKSDDFRDVRQQSQLPETWLVMYTSLITI